MNKKAWIILIALVLVFTSCTKPNIVEPVPSGNNQNKELKNISLNFISVSKETLNAEKPNTGWTKLKSIFCDEASGQKNTYLHLFTENDTNSNVVHAIIEQDKKTYAIKGAVSSYGIQNVEVKLVDRNFDDRKDIEIIGEMGASSIEMKIISYDEVSKQWVMLLNMGSPTVADLDNDGKEELIASSVGSLPGYVEIYKWNGDHFEKANVGEQTGSIYANINNVSGDWIIETGKANEPHYYKYFEGKLIEQENF